MGSNQLTRVSLYQLVLIPRCLMKRIFQVSLKPMMIPPLRMGQTVHHRRGLI